jgi:hypothetical protein
MNREQLTEAIKTGKLYAADVMADSVYVYYEPTGFEHEHAARYVKFDGVWTLESGIYGDLTAALGGEEAEANMLELLGMTDDK